MYNMLMGTLNPTLLLFVLVSSIKKNCIVLLVKLVMLGVADSGQPHGLPAGYIVV